MDVRYTPSKSTSLAMVLMTVLMVATPTTGVVQAIEWQVPLQKHIAFFDRNNDGIVYPSETFEGFRAIGAGIPLSTAAAVIINTGLSSTTRPGKGVDLKFPIEIENIALAKHTSDSGAYDNEGRFILSKFEEIFSKHAYTKLDALSSTELDKMLKANMKPNNKKGGFNAFIEWKVIFQLAKDKDGFLHKETLRKVYDGTLFYDMEKHQKEKLASTNKA